MASLFRRSNGIWYVVTTKRRKRVWRSTQTQLYCRAWLQFRVAHQSEKRNRLATLSYLRTEMKLYAATNLSQGTASIYKVSLKNFITVIGNLPLRGITVLHCEEFKRSRKEKVSPVRVNLELRTLKAALNYALSWGFVEENVMKKCKLLRIPDKEPAYLSPEDLRRLLASCPLPMMRTLIAFAILTMLRRGEIVNLEWTDVDFQRGLIFVRNKETFTVKGHRPRVIPITTRLHRLLAAIEHRSVFVFSTSLGEKLNDRWVTRTFKACVRDAGLSDAIHFHSLRHTGASWLVQRSVPLHDIQKILGHSSPVTTQIYSHQSCEGIRSSLEKLAISPYDE